MAGDETRYSVDLARTTLVADKIIRISFIFGRGSGVANHGERFTFRGGRNSSVLPEGSRIHH